MEHQILIFEPLIKFDFVTSPLLKYFTVLPLSYSKLPIVMIDPIQHHSTDDKHLLRHICQEIKDKNYALIL